MHRFICTLASVVLTVGYITAQITPSNELSEEEAFAMVKNTFSDMDPDFYGFTPEGELVPSYVTHYFVDPEPLMGWEHECYVVTVDKKKKQCSMNLYNMPPKGDYTIKEVKNRYGNLANHEPIVLSSNRTGINESVASKTYAIIISGGANKNINHKRYWNDCSFIYQTLRRKYEIPKENIIPLMSDGNDSAPDMNYGARIETQPLDLDFDGIDDIELAANYNNILKVFNELNKKLKEDDHLFVFVIDHGGRDPITGHSYICLWNNAKLYDYELQTLLQESINRFVNVNVVLGQCYSGGFVDTLTSIGCVVSTACKSTEVSYSCDKIPYDEFVYHWTSAINGATPFGEVVDADEDKNGHISMNEAFKYASEMDRATESPQYISTPYYIGEDLSFTNLPPAVNLLIKDNPEDTGVEPNLTTEKNWKSQSIWCRNIEDGIEQHENPYYTADHMACAVYAKIENRGKKSFISNQSRKWLHFYWALASTGFSNRAWTGYELYNDSIVTGGHISQSKSIPDIAPGETVTLHIGWSLSEEYFTEEQAGHHFCILAKISENPYAETDNPEKANFNVLGSKEIAQRNITIIPKANIAQGVSVFVRNVVTANNSYSLELVPCTAIDAAIYTYGEVQMQLHPIVYSGWAKGGFKSINVTRSTATPNVVKFEDSTSRLESINLTPTQFDKVTLKFKFNKKPLRNTPKYTFDLIQRDSNGNIIGGETFEVQSPFFSIIGIQSESSEDGKTVLKTIGTTESDSIIWTDGDDKTIGTGKEISVDNRGKNLLVNTTVYSEDGTIGFGEIMLEKNSYFENISYDEFSKTLKIEFRYTIEEGSKLEYRNIINPDVIGTITLLPEQQAVSFQGNTLNPGNYVISLIKDGEILESKTIKI